MTPAVTVVVGNYNGARLLPDLAASLAAQTVPPARTIVVDAASTDESARVSTELGLKFVPAENRGLGILYNRGVELASTRHVFLANNDIALAPDCLEQLADALDQDQSRFAADARQVDWVSGETIHARTTLTRGRLLREYLPGLHLDHQVPASAVSPTVCANGAAMLVRREAFLELGGFDETFFMEWEDLDLCWRAWLRGRPTVYVPDAVVRHRVGAVTTARIAPRRAASAHHNIVRFALKCLPPPTAGRVLAGVALRGAAHPRAVASGLAAVARELPEIAALRRRFEPSAALLRAALSDAL
jgi:GT2 family glycosyltransferase